MLIKKISPGIDAGRYFFTQCRQKIVDSKTKCNVMEPK